MSTLHSQTILNFVTQSTSPVNHGLEQRIGFAITVFNHQGEKDLFILHALKKTIIRTEAKMLIGIANQVLKYHNLNRLVSQIKSA